MSLEEIPMREIAPSDEQVLANYILAALRLTHDLPSGVDNWLRGNCIYIARIVRSSIVRDALESVPSEGEKNE